MKRRSQRTWNNRARARMMDRGRGRRHREVLCRTGFHQPGRSVGSQSPNSAHFGSLLPPRQHLLLLQIEILATNLFGGGHTQESGLQS